jgi:hypothetical protein
MAKNATVVPALAGAREDRLVGDRVDALGGLCDAWRMRCVRAAAWSRRTPGMPITFIVLRARLALAVDGESSCPAARSSGCDARARGSHR